MFGVSEFAYKVCTDNGTWQCHPDPSKSCGPAGWTDYTQCFTDTARKILAGTGNLAVRSLNHQITSGSSNSSISNSCSSICIDLNFHRENAITLSKI